MTCPTGNTPWEHSGSSPVTLPSVILLPAATITINKTWTLPSGTRIVGEGSNLTVLQPGSSFSGTSDMIDMGGVVGSTSLCPSNVCQGVVIEHLQVNGALNGVSQSLNGIVNQYSQDLSYVNDVALNNLGLTGLVLASTSGSSPVNSGPYSGITCNIGSAESQSAACAQILNVTGGTRGIHGLTCVSNVSNYSTVAVYLDSPNNSITDVRILGFDDGIRVGYHAAAPSNVLFNILGDTNKILPSPINVVHITNNYATSDLSIMGVVNQGVGSYSIQDDVTSTTLPDPSVAMYVLGKAVSVGGTNTGYSRFTTSPSAATWGLGTNSTPVAPCVTGSLYSYVPTANGAGAGALWVCKYQHNWTRITP